MVYGSALLVNSYVHAVGQGRKGRNKGKSKLKREEGAERVLLKSESKVGPDRTE